MGLLDKITAAFGDDSINRLKTMASSQSNPSAAASTDRDVVSAMLTHAPAGVVSSIFSELAGRMNPQEYAAHVTPGVNDSNPLGGLDSSGLSRIASSFIGQLTGPGGYSAESLLSRIPGLTSADPQQMNASQVAQVAQYTQQKHPNLFGQVISEVSQQSPGLIGSLLGNSALSQGASALASHFLQHAT